MTTLRLPRALSLGWIAIALTALLACEPVGSCGPGTALNADGLCEPTGEGQCGPGTTYKGGQCVPAASNDAGGDGGSAEDSGVAATSGSDSAAPGEDGAAADTAPSEDAEAVEVAVCTPACTGKVCGPDGCGGTCGTCSVAGEECSAAGQCQPCVPACQGKECGSDGCGGSCGSCLLVAGKPYCDGIGKCTAACVPNCQDNVCGPDGCGGVCGSCQAGYFCVLNQCDVLNAEESCAGKCGGLAASGCSCKPDCKSEECCKDFAAACPCIPQCDGKSCGPDGCGEVCGTCKAGSTCTADGQCQDDPCDPDPCNGHGSCSGGICTCTAAYAGATCEKCALGLLDYPSCAPDPCDGETCSDHGTCNKGNGSCTCEPGFKGPTCGSCLYPVHIWPACKASPCEGNTCSGHGACLTDTGECLCNAGFAGDDCSACAEVGGSYPNCLPANSGYLPSPALAGLQCPFCAPSLDKYSKPANPSDKTPPSVLVSVPPAGAVIAPGAPLILVLGDVLDGSTVTPQTFRLVAKGAPSAKIGGVVGLQATASGQSVLMLFPTGVVASGAYELVAEGIKDTGGNLLGKYALALSIDGAAAGEGFGGNLGLESGGQGCFFAGDSGASPASDNLSPSQGKQMLALTTADAPKISKAGALNGYGSLAICGPFAIPAGKTKLVFDYTFGSEEFDDYVGQGFDDFAVVALSGFSGGAGGVLTSVNTVGLGGTPTKAFGTSTEGDSQAKMTGWKSATVGNIGALGPYVVLSFVVTDVADTSMSSFFAVDHIRFE